MPKATLEFTLPEEAEEHRVAVAGPHLVAVLTDLDNELRAMHKHAGRSSVSIETLRGRLRELLKDRDLSWILG